MHRGKASVLVSKLSSVCLGSIVMFPQIALYRLHTIVDMF